MPAYPSSTAEVRAGAALDRAVVAELGEELPSWFLQPEQPWFLATRRITTKRGQEGISWAPAKRILYSRRAIIYTVIPGQQPVGIK
jgi:hypothetical protein